jgi:hypothetical protein
MDVIPGTATLQGCRPEVTKNQIEAKKITTGNIREPGRKLRVCFAPLLQSMTSTFFYSSPTSLPLFSLYAYMLWLVFHFLSFLLNSPAMLATFGIFDASKDFKVENEKS